MTKLEELKAAADAAYDAAAAWDAYWYSSDADYKAAYADYEAASAASDAYVAACDAFEAAWDAYKAELKKIQTETDGEEGKGAGRITFGTSLTKEARARNAPAEYTPSSELGDGTEVELMERPQIRRKKIRRAKGK
jgi:hypothetical protein